jgi:hypothetical protein
MHTSRRRIAFLGILLTLALALILGGCAVGNQTGSVELSITDAPLLGDDVVGVYITVQSIEFHLTSEEWMVMEDFEGPQTFNLMELTNGTSRMLGELVLPVGEYTQLRFILGAPAQSEDGGIITTVGSWIEIGTDNGIYDDGTDKPLFVPSGSQTGYKATAGEPFTVPHNGTVAITADFDLRRAVVVRGSTGSYLLKPVLRLIVEGEAGTISGDITTTSVETLMVFAYADGIYDVAEAADPVGDEPRFPNAVSSGLATFDGDNPDYLLAFLAVGTYDLVVAEYDATTGDFLGVLGTLDDVVVNSEQTTDADIDVTPVL